MRFAYPVPSRTELHAERVLSREEHARFLRLCEIGARLAKYLHAKPDPAKAEATLRKIIASGYDLEDGSIFDCAICWQAAKTYRTSKKNAPKLG
jgi:hypothetical protein